MLLTMSRQFSIRTLMIILAVAGLTLSWIASHQRRSSLERLIISEIQSKYAGFEIIHRSTPLLCGTGVSGIADRNPTNSLDRLFGQYWPETFDHVTRVSINGLRYNNDVMSFIDRLPNLQSIRINRTSVSPTAVNRFRRSNPRIEIEVVEPTFEMTDENDPAQILESINHW